MFSSLKMEVCVSKQELEMLIDELSENGLEKYLKEVRR